MTATTGPASGRPIDPASLTDAVKARFYAKVGPADENGCRPWTGHRYGGHGRFRLDGHTVWAHRVAWVLANGTDIPPGLVVRHKVCDNPACQAPEHLELGSQFDNMRDMNERGRHWCTVKVACPRGHSLSVSANLSASHVAKGKRACRSCVNARSAARHDVTRNGAEPWSDERIRAKADEYYARFLAESTETAA